MPLIILPELLNCLEPLGLALDHAESQFRLIYHALKLPKIHVDLIPFCTVAFIVIFLHVLMSIPPEMAVEVLLVVKGLEGHLIVFL